jgi:hypothetical protein
VAAPPRARSGIVDRLPRLVIAAGVVLTVVAIAMTLTARGPRLAATNSKVLASRYAFPLAPGATRCQGGEYVPASTTFLRIYPGLAKGATAGPAVDIQLRDVVGNLITTTPVKPGYTASPLDVPFAAPRHDIGRGVLCFVNKGDVKVFFAGNLTSASPDAVPGTNGPAARVDTDEFRVDYFRSRDEPMWRLVPDVLRRYDVLRPTFVHPWTLPAVLVAYLLVAAAALWLVLRRRLPESRTFLGLPAVVWCCTLIAMANACVWALVTPTYQPADEPVHVGYAEYVAERNQLPGTVTVSSRRELARPAHSQHYALFRAYPFNVESKPTWSPAEDRAFRVDAAEPGLPLADRYAPGSAADSPPLYYLPLAAALKMVAGADPINRLFVLRVLSGLMASFTVLFVYLFCREVLPSRPLAWLVGALAVAFQPVFGQLSGAVINDDLIFTLCAALLFLIARSFRHGLTWRRGLAIGLVLAAGDLTKTRMLLVAPATGLALVVLALRADSARQRLAQLRAAALGAGAFAAIEASWQYVATSVLHRTTGVDRITTAAAGEATSFTGRLSYIWQYFLPRLPFMADQFRRWPQYGVWEVYVQGFVGRFGFFQYSFPLWVNQVGLAVLVAIAALATAGLWRHRAALRARWLEGGLYAAFFGSLVLLVATAGYSYRAATTYNLEQTRYLFPCLALYGGVVGLALLGAGRRAERVVATALVVVFAGHTLASLLLTVHRYYV